MVLLGIEAQPLDQYLRIVVPGALRSAQLAQSIIEPLWADPAETPRVDEPQSNKAAQASKMLYPAEGAAGRGPSDGDSHVHEAETGGSALDVIGSGENGTIGIHG